MKSGSSVQPQNAELVRVEELLQSLLARFASAPAPEPIKKGRKRRKPGKRDTVIFAALLMELRGLKYCSFIQEQGIKPKWSDSGPATYPKSYQVGDPWRKKVQDEKTRAKLRMSLYPDSELADALNKRCEKAHESPRESHSRQVLQRLQLAQAQWAELFGVG